MKQMLQICCKNNKTSEKFELGSTILQVYEKLKPEMKHRPLCALVNNRIEGLRFRLFGSKQIEFLDITSAAGRKIYARSLSFVLWKAVEDLYPGTVLMLEAPVSNGYYFTLSLGHPVTLENAAALKKRMKEIIDEGHEFHRIESPTDEAAALFRERGMINKARLFEGLGRLYTYYYKLCDTVDYYYGPLVPSTDYLDLFDLVKYYDGLLLRIPRFEDSNKLGELVKQEKMLNVFREDHQLEQLLGVCTVGELNAATTCGASGDIIKIAEALQEKKICHISDRIASLPDVKVILIAGPSSSGKTTFSKRLSIQLMASGLKPYPISLDDYFVNREDNPIDENGEYDYESIYALNLELFNKHLRMLLAGEEIELPRYDFAAGKSVMSGKHLKLSSNMILILEGIHALNPMLTKEIPDDRKFKIYVSALTTIKLDNHNYIPTTDNRLIRRIVRDFKYRGSSAADTIARWPSVRRGEDKWIFPYQENADVMFNSALLYELAVLKNQAIPVLESVNENQPEYAVANSLIQFLKYFRTIPDRELPPTSILREFLGGSSFKY
ncbi:MAG: nucleoside kinase [Bacteroides sp.]|nr:nucleoside kinase [Bacteroides sp.]MCM1421956.1 nucleoside kinase [Bacteroides sp.]